MTAPSKPDGAVLSASDHGASGAAAPPDVSAQKERNSIIDGYRGFAILSVMAFHYLVRYPDHLDWAYSRYFGLGQLGVEVFFVISGLVITMTVERSKGFLDFAVKRFARIYPAYLFAATLVFLVLKILDPMNFNVKLIDYIATLTMNADLLRVPFVDGAYWTLAVELRFYLIISLAFFLFGKQFWISIIALGFLGNIVDTVYHPLAVLLIQPYISLFIFGIAGWLGLFENRKLPSIFCVAFGIIFYYFSRDRYMVDGISSWAGDIYIFLGAGSMMMLLYFRSSISLGPLAFIGRISYSLYLVHQRLGVTIIDILKRNALPDWLAVSAAVAICILLAMWMFRFVEQPGQMLVKKAYQKMIA